MQGCLAKVLLFKQLDPSMQRKVVSETYERTVQAGEILITEGDTGLAASELYIVKSGEFEVLPRCPPSSSCSPLLHFVQRADSQLLETPTSR